MPYLDYQNHNRFENEIYQTVTIDKQINHDLTFIDCEFKNLGFLGNQLYEKRSFEFENCKIDRIEIGGNIRHLSFVNCTIGNFFQLRDSDVSLLNFYATSNK